VETLKIRNWTGIQAELVRLQQRLAKDEKRLYGSRTPATLRLNSKSYEVVSRLGGGGHGTVYHVKDPARRSHAIKVYRPDAFGYVHAALVALERQGVPTIASEPEVDNARKSARYRYVDGVSVYDVERSESTPKWVKKAVRGMFNAWWEQYIGYTLSRKASTDDVILHIGSGHMFQIDPG
jgi:serine/threonine protein kinase